jgi:6-phosphogluconolactonase (cycloisomerase 2 family)
MSVLPLLLAAALALVAPARAGAVPPLVMVDLHRDGKHGADGLAGVTAVTLSPDGAHAYAAGANEDAIAVFRRDPASGTLALVEVVRDGVGGVDGLDHVVSVVLSADGRHAYATGYRDNALAVFARDPASGRLTFTQVVRNGVDGVHGLGRTTAAVLSPDDAHLYATGYVDWAVTMFRRDPGDGTLTMVGVLWDGLFGADGLAGARGIAVSPDGAHVYVAGDHEDAVALFARDAATGVLTFVAAFRDGEAGFEGLDGTHALAVSPDGAHVYVAGRQAKALAVLARDGTTGLLTPVEVHRNGVGGVTGLDRPLALAWSPDATRLYVGSADWAGAAVFARDPATGALAFLDTTAGPLGGGNGLAQVHSLAPSPDGAHVYVTGCPPGACFSGLGHGDAVAAFRPRAVACDPAPLPSAECRGTTAPGAALLQVKDHADDRRDRLLWKWRGAATPPEAFGDPIASATDYALCVYDGSAASQPRLAAVVPGAAGCAGKPCWRSRRAGQLAYNDPPRTRDGIQKIALRAGADGDARAQVDGKGANLRLGGLPLAGPVTVQLRTAGGACWQATYGTALRNDAGRYKAKSD